MNSRRILVNATNCHVGGGKTLLNGFLKGVKESTERVIIFVDKRFQPVTELPQTIELIKVDKFTRFFVSFRISALAREIDIVLYFGNLPPFLKFKTHKVYLLLSSRFYVDTLNLQGFSFKDKIKICSEKFYFKIFLKNVSDAIVQTSTMRKLLEKSGFKRPIYVWAFDDIGDSDGLLNPGFIKDPNSFLYVASLLPYKNHRRLLFAWKNLKKEGLNPKLYLNLDQDNSTKTWIEDFVIKNRLNVTFLIKLDRSELIKYYQKSEVLIYPSLFEAYGLPLIEAKKYGLKILASDLDYSWDFITPDGFFNPYDCESIARAVKRYLNTAVNLDKIHTPDEFIFKLTIL